MLITALLALAASVGIAILLYLVDRRLGRDLTPWHWQAGPITLGCLVRVERGIYRGNKAMVRGVYPRRFLVWRWYDVHLVMTFAELGKEPFDVKTLLRAADVTVLERPRTDQGKVIERGLLI